MNRTLGLTVFIVAVGVLLAPIAIYIWHFGWRISSDHDQWADMGSAMAGIYGPIIAAATLFMLYRQTTIMANAVELQSRTTELLTAQDLRQKSSDDIKSRWARLNHHLQKISKRIDHLKLHTEKLEALNLDGYWLITVDALRKVATLQRAGMDYKRDPSLMDCWAGIRSAMAGITETKVSDEGIQATRQNEFEQMQLHIAASLSTPVATALDNMTFALNRSGPFYFNENLNVLDSLPQGK